MASESYIRIRGELELAGRDRQGHEAPMVVINFTGKPATKNQKCLDLTRKTRSGQTRWPDGKGGRLPAAGSL